MCLVKMRMVLVIHEWPVLCGKGKKCVYVGDAGCHSSRDTHDIVNSLGEIDIEFDELL
jgi:hypothetical protein